MSKERENLFVYKYIDILESIFCRKSVKIQVYEVCVVLDVCQKSLMENRTFATIYYLYCAVKKRGILFSITDSACLARAELDINKSTKFLTSETHLQIV